MAPVTRPGRSVTHDHTEYIEGCFACKVKTLHWGMVPGGYRFTSSDTNYDPDTLPDFPTKEEVMDARHDYRHAPVKEMRLDASTGLPQVESSS